MSDFFEPKVPFHGLQLGMTVHRGSGTPDQPWTVIGYDPTGGLGHVAILRAAYTSRAWGSRPPAVVEGETIIRIWAADVVILEPEATS